MDFDLFVIGGGSAGVRCARIAAGHGARVGIAEERFWGGTCVNVGCVPKKLLVQAGEYGAWAEDAAGFGWQIKKGPHDWAKLIAAKDREIGRLNGIYKRLLDNAGATSLRRARHASSIRTRSMSAASASPPSASSSPPAAIRCACRSPAPNSASSPTTRSTCRTCRSAWRSSAPATSRWSSPASSPALGAHVDLVYRQPLPLRGFDHGPARVAGRGARRAGHRAASRPAGRRSSSADGDERVLTFGEGHTLRTDLVFFATGRAPATKGLGLEQGRRDDRTTRARWWSTSICAPASRISTPWATSPTG